MRKVLLMIALLGGLSLILAGCNSGGGTDNGAPSTDATEDSGGASSSGTVELNGDAENGAKLFSINCAVCHGMSGEGLVGPPMTAGSWGGNDMASVGERLTVEEHLETVSNGKNQMPPWKNKFSEQELHDVTAYERSLQ